MSALDVAARGLARRALAVEEVLASEEGASRVGYRIDNPEAVERTLRQRTETMVYFEDFGAIASVGDPGPEAKAANTRAINRAFAHGVANSVPVCSQGTYHLDGTVAPGGSFTWHAGRTQLAFDPWDSYTEIQHNPAGAAYAGSGKFVAFDNSGCTSSVVSGHLRLVASVAIPNMRKSTRAKLPANLVALSAATSSGAELTFDFLEIMKFGHALWQGNFSGTAPSILPYTRLNARFALIRFCGQAFESGAQGNGFDDMRFGVLRISRCAGTSLIRGTDITVNSFFTIGLDKNQDIESETIAFAAGSTSATLSSDSAEIEVGSKLGFLAGGRNKAGADTGFVAEVTAKSGTELTLSHAPSTTQPAAAFCIDPPTFKLTAGNLTTQHAYMEHLWDGGIVLQNAAKFTSADFKHSGSTMCYRYNAPIVLLGDRARVDVTLHHVSENNPYSRSVVFAGSRRDLTTHRGGAVVVKSRNPRAEWTHSDPIRVGESWPTDLFGGTEASGDYNKRLDLKVQFSDGTAFLMPFAGGGYGATQTSSGPPLFQDLALISSATVIGNFSAVSEGVSTKTSGGIGALIHSQSLTEGQLYRVLFRTSAFTGGGPQLRLHNNNNLVEIKCTVCRNGALTAVHFTAAGSINQVRIFGFASDSYAVDMFTLQEVLAL